MILLLVDDEFHVRKKLLHKIDWEALGIDTLLEAEDGESGYETAKRRKIDILISDIRMPRMDGIEMAEKIRELYPDCVILFLSGYSDKEYLRSAISLHALSYIDKPVSPEQVVSAVREAVDYCNNMQNSTVFAAKIKEARLVRLLCSPRPGEEQLTSLLKDCGLSPLSFSDSRTLLLQSLSADGIPAGLMEHADELFAQSGLRYIMGDYHDNFLVIHLLSGEEQLVSDLSRPFLRSLLQRLSYLLKNQSYFIAVGVLAENLHELYHSYQSAVISLQQNFFLGMNSISFAGDSDASGYTPDDNFRKGLLSCVKQKDAEGCFRLLDSLYAAYQSHPSGLISMVREDYYACLSQLFQHCLAHRIDFQSASSQQLWDVISSAHTLKELHAIAVNLYQSYFDFVRENREEASVSGNIRRLVEENYGNPSLGLQFLSENLKLSQSYISQLFKQETGTTINQYIISFRIDMASSQLLKSDRKIADIALSCGFPDQNYFTKLFKKCTGMTPSEYRGYV